MTPRECRYRLTRRSGSLRVIGSDGEEVELTRQDVTSLQGLVRNHGYALEMTREGATVELVFEGQTLREYLGTGASTWKIGPLEIEFFPEQPRTERRVRRPFAHTVHVALEFLCSPKTMVIVNQTIADIREEECEALALGRTAKARWIHIRGHWTLFKALGLNAVVKVLAKVVAPWKSAS